MTKRMLLIVGCVLALGVGVAACGDDDDDGTAASTTAAPTNTANEDIVALAQSTPDLATLADAVVAADLVGTLQAPGPYTVFAPNNAAFEALGAQTLNDLLKPANQEQLANILTYHVVPGEAMAADLRNGQTLRTAQGGTLKVKVADGKVMVNGATVITADVDASNGVVHVIDEVLTPPQQ